MQSTIDRFELITAVRQRLIDMALLSVAYTDSALDFHLSRIEQIPATQNELVELIVDQYVDDMAELSEPVQ